MICLEGFEPRAALVAVLALGMPVTLAATVLAQERPLLLAQADKAEKLDSLNQRDLDLKAARDAQKKSIETEAALKREIEQIDFSDLQLHELFCAMRTLTLGKARSDGPHARAAAADE